VAIRTLLCVPITQPEPPLAEQVREARRAGADLVELRVDCIGDVEAVEELLRGPRELPMIVTIRPTEEGGHWDGSEADRIALIERLGLLLPGYVDVEWSAWQRSANLRQKIELVCRRIDEAAAGQDHPAPRPRNAMILSHHDLRGVPAELAVIFDGLAATPAEVVKAAFLAHDASDAIRVLEELRWRVQQFAAAGHDRGVIALAMGEAGVCTRVLARKFGAYLTFAGLRAGAESAPGQIPVRQLREVYRWDEVGPGTAVYGVVGWPVGHSRSPQVHNAAMRALGIDGVYVPLPVGPQWADLSAFLDRVSDSSWLDLRGLSVTLPHKTHALRWLEQHGHVVSERARRCGAVNTLARRADGGWEGDNTDAAGALIALEELGLPSASLEAAILGAGGVAGSIAAALLERGCRVTIFNRTAGRAARLAARLGCGWAPWEQRPGRGVQLIINCTSVGMWPRVEDTPLDAACIPTGAVVFDTVYQPSETRLLREARQRGCRTTGGSEMFLRQAALQFRRWHGIDAPLEVMRSAL
jgi:3-dehydroquinate dehydratase/shikimate dehydrogenase